MAFFFPYDLYWCSICFFQVGSRVKVAGLIKHKTLNGKLGVATSSLAAKGIDGFSVRLDGLDKEKLFRRVNLIEGLF